MPLDASATAAPQPSDCWSRISPEQHHLRPYAIPLRGDASPQSKLSERDLEVFRMMAEGQTNAEIAERLNLSTKTISNISQHVKEELGVHRQADITRLAMIISP